MKPIKTKCSIVLMIIGLVIASFIFSGCASKAKAIRVGAAQFRADSDSAVTKMDEFHKKVVQPEASTPEQASQNFVEGVIRSSGPINRSQLRNLMDPFSFTLKSEAQWQAFLQKLRQQNAAFEDTFASLERGSLFAAADVKKMIPILDKMIAQNAAFAQRINLAPVEFLDKRNFITDAIIEVRDSPQLSAGEKELKLKDLYRQLKETQAEEDQIKQETMGQALKAADTGLKLRQLLIDYDRLSVDDINEGLSQAFKLAAGIPGLDIPQLQTKTDEIMGAINNDANLKAFFDTAFAEVHQARTK